MLIVICSCELFNNPSDPDFLDNLYTELAWANAETVNVLVSTGGMGTASPGGSQQVKLWQDDFSRYGYTPFTVNYQPFNQYPFTGWQAWYAGEEPFATWRPDGETGADRVKFERANDTGTSVRIYIYEQGNIYIGPLGADTSNIEVRVIADSRWGTVFTAPVVHTKMGFSFPVEFSASGAWDFLGWRAYAFIGQSVDEINASELTGNELPPEDVDITVTGAGRATVTINTSRPVLLVPLCVVPVRVSYTNPPHSSGKDYGLSQLVTIAFSTYLNKNTVKLGSDFITITGQTDAIPFDITERFIISHNENADMVYITPNTPPLPDEVTVTITVGTEVKGLYGNNINAPFSFSYNVNADTGVTVTNSYQAVNIWALHNPANYNEEFFSQWGNYDRDRRLRKTGGNYQVTLYFGVRSVGEISNDVAHDIEIAEIHYATLRGDEIAASLGRDVTEGLENVAGSAVITNIDDDIDPASAYYRNQNAAAGMRYYKAVYTWASSPTSPTQGILRLVVLPATGEVSPEDWETVVLANRGYISVVYDDIAPGGPALTTFGGFANYDEPNRVFDYNKNHKEMELAFNLRNIRDNFDSADNSVNGNMNATANKPRSMDGQVGIEWQWRIATNGTQNHLGSVWQSLLDNSGESSHSITLDLSTVPTLEGTEGNGSTDIRQVQIRYRDELGRIINDDETNTSDWTEIGKFRYYTPQVSPLPSWSVTYNAANGTYSVDWEPPTANFEGVEVSVNSGEWLRASSKPYVLPNIHHLPINTRNVRNGEIEAAVETKVMVRSYNGTVRDAATPQIRIFNSLGANGAGLTINSTHQGNGSYNTTLGSSNVNVIVVDKSNWSTALVAVNRTAVFLLAEDITLGADLPGDIPNPWTPLGDSDDPFTGNFYGNGHTITINSLSDAADIGLFGIVNGGTVRDLTVLYDANSATPEHETVTVDPTNSFGGIAGTVSGGTRFENVLVSGAVLVAESGEVRAGGIVGQITSTATDPRATITNAYSDLNLTVNRAGSIGGVVGFIGTEVGAAALLEKITKVGNITVGEENNRVNGWLNAGGFAGFVRGANTGASLAVFNDVKYKDGIITVNKGTGDDRIGGAIGHINGYIDIQNCSSVAGGFNINKGSSTNTYSFYIGGFFGEAQGTDVIVENCYSENSVNIGVNGTVTLFGAGGFAGRSNINIRYCYAKGDVNVRSSSDIFVGGFVGFINGGTISFCYATGNVSGFGEGIGEGVLHNGALSIGGFAGVAERQRIFHSYALGNVYANGIDAFVSAGGFAGEIYEFLLENCFALGNVIAHITDNTHALLNAGGHTGRIMRTSIVKNCVVAVLPGNLNAGMSITVTGDPNSRIGRVYGQSFNSAPSSNYAWNGIRLFKDHNYDTGNPAPEASWDNFHSGKDGADAGSALLRTRSFWEEDLDYTATVNIDGKSYNAWDFFGIEGRGYPRLRTADGGLLGGQ